MRDKGKIALTKIKSASWLFLSFFLGAHDLRAGSYQIYDYPFYSTGSWPSSLKIQTFFQGINGNTVTGFANAGKNEAFSLNLTTGIWNNYGSGRYLFNNDGNMAFGEKDSSVLSPDTRFVVNLVSGIVLVNPSLTFQPRDINSDKLIGSSRFVEGGQSVTKGVIYSMANQNQSSHQYSNFISTEFYSVTGDKIFGKATANTGDSKYFIFDSTALIFQELQLPSDVTWTDSDGTRILGFSNTNGYNQNVVFDLPSMNVIPLSLPNINLQASTIHGDLVVGYFYDDSQLIYRSLVYTIPEPSSLSLLLAGGAVLAAGRRRY
jgi:hypothetical protein